jgi:hypothetical protein
MLRFDSPVMNALSWKFDSCIPRNETARPRSQFLHSWYIFPGLVCLFGCSKIGRQILVYINRSQIHECGNWKTEHYNSVLEITRPHSFISGNTSIGTRHLYWPPWQNFQACSCHDHFKTFLTIRTRSVPFFWSWPYLDSTFCHVNLCTYLFLSPGRIWTRLCTVTTFVSFAYHFRKQSFFMTTFLSFSWSWLYPDSSFYLENQWIIVVSTSSFYQDNHCSLFLIKDRI